MATSANGLIQDANGRTPWCDSEWSKYKQTLQQSGCLIVGRHTHEIMDRQGEYERLSINRVVVLTKSNLLTRQGVTTSDDLDGALSLLESEGFKEVIVGGGAQINALFLRANKVNEIYLDIEPFLFGGGLPLFAPNLDFNLNLQLEAVDRYAINSVGLRYSVLSQTTDK